MNEALMTCHSQGNTSGVIPLYRCTECDTTICAACAMTGHVDQGHQCTRVSQIRKKLGDQLEEQLLEIKQFTDEDFTPLLQEMEDTDRRLTGNLQELRKLCTARNQLQAKSQRMLNEFDITAERSSIAHLKGTIFSLENLNEQCRSLLSAWQGLKVRLAESWKDFDPYRPSTPGGAQEEEKKLEAKLGICAGQGARRRSLKECDDSKDKIELNDGNMSDRSREETPSCSSAPKGGEGGQLKPGEIVWGRFKSAKPWPAMVLDPRTVGLKDMGPRNVALYWFGYNRITDKLKVTAETVVPFEEGFSALHGPKDKREWYHEGVEEALRELLRRKCGKMAEHGDGVVTEAWLKTWARDGFPFHPPHYVQEVVRIYRDTEARPGPGRPRKRKAC